MPNALLTNSLITKEALSVISEVSALIPNVTVQEVSNNGTGDNPYISLRKPAQLNGRVGSTTWSGEDIKEDSTALALTKVYGADFSFNDSEMALTIDMMRERYIEPAVRKIVSNLERDFYADALAYSGSRVTTTAGTALDSVFKARTALSNRGALQGNRKYIANPDLMEGIVTQGRGLFQDATEISKQYKEGMAGVIGGFDIFESYRAPVLTVGAAVDGSVAVGMTEGSDVITIAGLAAGAIAKGQPFTIAGCFDVNPETKQSLGTLKVFRAVQASSAGSVKVQDKIYFNDPRKNVSALINATVAVDYLGTANARQGLAFHKSAISFGCVELESPKGTDIAKTMSEDGLSIRFIRDFDVNSGLWKCRFDLQAGWSITRPEHVCGIELA